MGAAERWRNAGIRSRCCRTSRRRSPSRSAPRPRSRASSDQIDEVLVPTEDVIEMRRGKKVQAERRFMPGYVLVHMEMSDETYHLITSINRVTGFLGPQGRPMPMRDAEVNAILNRVEEGEIAPRNLIRFEIGERVRVNDGPFEDFDGMVEGVDDAAAAPQGLGLDLRPGHPGRSGILSGDQDLLRTAAGPRPWRGSVGGKGDASPGPGPRNEGPRRRAGAGVGQGGPAPTMKERPHGQESHRVAEAAGEGAAGEPVPAGRARARPARHQHHGVREGIQRAHGRHRGRAPPSRSSSPTTPTRASRWSSRRRPRPSSSRRRPA